MNCRDTICRWIASAEQCLARYRERIARVRGYRVRYRDRVARLRALHARLRQITGQHAGALDARMEGGGSGAESSEMLRRDKEMGTVLDAMRELVDGIDSDKP